MDQQHQHQSQQQRQYSLDPGTQCPFCGAAKKAGADICEACKAWQLDDQCSFCYAPVSPGQKFCRQCGNAPQGITCPGCNTLSHFDFCPTCSTPLSRGSGKFLEAMEDSELFTALKTLDAQISSIPVDLNASSTGNAGAEQQEQQKQEREKQEQEKQQALLDLMQKYKEGFEVKPAAAAPKKSGFEFGSGPRDVRQELEKAEALRQQQQSSVAGRKAMEQELRAKVAAMQEQVFADNQSARKFYASIKILVPKLTFCRESRVIGWQCRYTNTIHPGPEECAEPGLGGKWIYEHDESYTTNYNEI